MSPELASKRDYFGPAADIWACGVLTYAMLCGQFPFRGSTDKELVQKIQKAQPYWPPHVPKDAIDFVTFML
jgi:serine/threonine protein kinase